ncbi:MAG: nitroreductase family protein [Bacillota bacterium]
MLKEDLIAIIKTRRSIRKFTDERISDEDIRLMIDLAASAPSNNNRQPWKFIVLKNNEMKNAVTEAVNKKIRTVKESLRNEDMTAIINSYQDYLLFIKDAPVLIFVLYKNPPAVVTEFLRELKTFSVDNVMHNELISVSMAIENMLLTAHALGLGTCCTTGPLIAAEEIKLLLDIRPPFELAAVIALGRYENSPEAPPRKPLSDIIEVIE